MADHEHTGWSINGDRSMLVAHLLGAHDLVAIECPDPADLHLELHGVGDEELVPG